jgi:hypothetical protein
MTALTSQFFKYIKDIRVMKALMIASNSIQQFLTSAGIRTTVSSPQLVTALLHHKCMYYQIGKGTANPVQACTGPEDFWRLRFEAFMTTGT